MNKTLYILHTNEGKHAFDQYTKDVDAEVVFARSSDFVMDYGNGKNKKPTLYFGTKKINLNKSYFHFLAKGGKNSSITSPLIHFLRGEKGHYSNAGYEHHSNLLSKHVTLYDLASQGIAIPRTCVLFGIEIKQHIDLLEKHMGYPMVIKGRGSEGESVYLCKNRRSVYRAVRTMNESANRAKVISVQEVLDSPYDVRVIMSFGKVVAAMKRQSQDFKNNYALGGEVSQYLLDAAEKKVVSQVHKKIDLDVYGIDFMHHKGEPRVLEIQHGPGLEGIRIANPEVNFEQTFIQGLNKQLNKLD